MADNIPTNIIRNIPPTLRVQPGNNGDSFILPDGAALYYGIHLAQEVITRDPIEQETGDSIDV